MARRASTAIAFLLVTGSCMFPTAPEGAKRFFPVEGSSMFGKQYDIVQKCVGELFNGTRFLEIKWYSVPGDSIQTRKGKWVAAFSRGDAIYMASKYLTTDFVIGHEIAHQITGIGNSHRDPPFWKCNLMPAQHPFYGISQLSLDEEE
jgi:hypothetical protein